MDYYLKSKDMIFYRLRKINDLHLSDTFVPSRVRLSFFLVFGYIFLFVMFAIPNGPVSLKVEIIALLLLLIIDLVLLGDLLRFFWDKTCRPIFVLKSFLLFKATTLPIICGTLGGLINYLIQDESCLNKTKSSSDIVVTNPAQYNK